MKILMLAPAPFEFDRGKSLRIKQSVDHLETLGHEIEILTYPSGKEREGENVRITRTSGLLEGKNPSKPGISGNNLLSNAEISFRALKRANFGNYDVIHAHDIDGALAGVISDKLSWKKHKVIYDMHGSFKELNKYYKITKRDNLVEKTEDYLYKNSDHVIANWPHLLENIPKKEDSKTLIMDEPDPEVVRYLEEDLQTEEFEEDSYILYTGNYANYQGIDLLLDSFEKADTELKLVMTGNPPEKYRRENEKIHYTGFVEKKKLAALMQNAKILVSPRLTDGFPPMKILYYNRTKNPIIATNKTCHTSILEEKSGVFFTETKEKEFAQRIEEVSTLNNRYDRKVLQESVEEKYSSIYENL